MYKYLESKILEGKKQLLELALNRISAAEWEPDLISSQVGTAFNEYRGLEPELQDWQVRHILEPFQLESHYNSSIADAYTDTQLLRNEAENLYTNLLGTYNYFLNLFLTGRQDAIAALQEASTRAALKSYGDRFIVTQENFFDKDGVLRLPETKRLSMALVESDPVALRDNDPHTVWTGETDSELKLTLQTQSVINGLSLTPYLENKDSKFKIVDIFFSVDGNLERSIFDFLGNPPLEYITQKFLLDYNEYTINDFIIYFLPIVTKYIRIVFSGTPRLRDLKVLQIHYDDTQIYSRNFTFKTDIARAYFRPLSDLNPGVNYSVNGEAVTTLVTQNTDAFDIAKPSMNISMSLHKEFDPAYFTKISNAVLLNKAIRTNIQSGFNTLLVPEVPLENSIAPLELVGKVGSRFELATIIASNANVISKIDYSFNLSINNEDIFVEGVEITKLDSEAELASVDGYFVDYDKKFILIKGYSGTVYLELPEEKLNINSKTNTAILSHYADGQTITVVKVALPAEHVFVIPSNAKQFALPFKNVVETKAFAGVVPRSRKVFYLPYLAEDSTITFEDRTVFATRVATEAAVTTAGKYWVGSADKQMKVVTKLPTNAGNPGRYFINASGSILNYAGIQIPTVDQEIQYYKPIFSDETIFTRETNTIKQHGDYKINYLTGFVQSFSPANAGTTIAYGYQTKEQIPFEFAKDKTGLPIYNRIKIDSSKISPSTTKEFVIANNNFILSDGTLIPYSSVYIIDPKITHTYNGSSFIPDTDFLRGELSTSEAKVHQFQHNAILKGSVAIHFFADNKYCVFDRAISRTPAGLVISPIECDGSEITDQTQRSLDRSVFLREVEFINGVTELEQSGDYSIDYINGFLFSFDEMPAEVVFQYQFADLYVNYDAYLLLDAVLKADRQTVTFSSKHTATGILLYSTFGLSQEDMTRLRLAYSPLVFGYNLQLDMGRING